MNFMKTLSTERAWLRFHLKQLQALQSICPHRICANSSHQG